MKKAVYLFLLGFCLFGLDSCKKDRGEDNNPDPGPDMETVKVQVILPTGSSVDLSKTRMFTLGSTTAVGSDGKADIPLIGNSGQLVFLFDEADNLMMESYITPSSKEISVKTTAQALLFQGLQQMYLPDSAKNVFLQKSAAAAKLGDYYAKMEQTFKADPLMLEKRLFASALREALTLVNQKNVIDIHGKQIRIVDDEERSKIKMESVDVENINILNSAYRRAHAFVYKTAYRDRNNLETVLNSTVNFDDKSDKDLKVEKIRFLSNFYDQVGVAQGFKTAVTGPVYLPVAANEREATYKVRVLGPGAPVSASLTNDEKAKLDELYYQYLAYDIVAPLMLEALGYRSLISGIDEQVLQGFYEKVQAIAKTDPGVMDALRRGAVYQTVQRFNDAVVAGNFGNGIIENALIEGMKLGYKGGNISFPSAQTIADYQKKIDKGLELLKFATGVVSGPFILAPHDYFNEMEEFEVKSQDNNVKLSPKESSMSTFTNQTLTANANVEVSAGQTLVYRWTTTGQFGVLKNGSQQGLSIESSSKTITYYANVASSALDEDNIDKVFVTVVIKQNGTEIEVGGDTASINVKKNKLVMKPANAELDIAHGSSRSVKLYLLKADGTNEITPNPVLDYKVVWTTAGSFGQLTGNATSYTAYDNNSTTYTVFDDDNIPDGSVETISAKVYIKTKNGSSWSFLEQVSGKVTISNDEKKIILYASSQSVHKDAGNWCYVGCIVSVPAVPNAKSYVVVDASDNSSVASWNVTGTEKKVYGYTAGYGDADVSSGYAAGIYGTWSWGGPLDPNAPQTTHFSPPNCGGTYKITVTLTQ